MVCKNTLSNLLQSGLAISNAQFTFTLHRGYNLGCDQFCGKSSPLPCVYGYLYFSLFSLSVEVTSKHLLSEVARETSSRIGRALWVISVM